MSARIKETTLPVFKTMKALGLDDPEQLMLVE